MPARELRVKIFQEADALVAAGLGAVVAGELDEVECVQDRERAREVADERQTRLQRADDERLAPGEVPRDLGAELSDAGVNLLGV